MTSLAHEPVVAGVALAASPIFRTFGNDQINLWVTR
jgi:hypothetical protein